MNEQFSAELAAAVSVLDTDTKPKRTHTFRELWDAKDDAHPFLIPDLIPSESVTLLIGEDGIGKTQLLAQLALEIARGKPEFLTLPMNVRHRSVLFCATEDSRQKFTSAITKQYKFLEMEPSPDDINIRFTEGSEFDTLEELITEIQNDITANPVDLVITDALSDLFTFIDGEINSNTHARRILGLLQKLAVHAQCAFVVIHHAAKTKIVAKRKEGKMFLEKFDSQGAGAISQKPRTVLALSHDPKTINDEGSEYTNYLHVIKANLMGKTYAKNALELYFSTYTLLHQFKGMVDIDMMENTDQDDPANDPRKKVTANDVTDAQHFINIRKIFGEKKSITREDLIRGICEVYQVGQTKVKMKGGYLNYLQNNQFIYGAAGIYRPSDGPISNVLPEPESYEDAPF